MDIKAKLFESGFEIFDNLLGENVRIVQIPGIFHAFVSESDDI